MSDFYISKTEVTVFDYKKYCFITENTMPPEPPWGWLDNNPITNVTWQEAKNYCSWLNCRLPTEAEFEYSIRDGGKEVRWAGTNSIEELNGFAWLNGNSMNKVHTVASKKPNALGVYDLTGNVLEWCSDRYLSAYRSDKSNINQTTPSMSEMQGHVIRGGAYNLPPSESRASSRFGANTFERYVNVGFRIVRK